MRWPEFSAGKAASGTYPWPGGQAGHVVEINEREFAYLLSKSIVPLTGGLADSAAASDAGAAIWCVQ